MSELVTTPQLDVGTQRSHHRTWNTFSVTVTCAVVITSALTVRAFSLTIDHLLQCLSSPVPALSFSNGNGCHPVLHGNKPSPHVFRTDRNPTQSHTFATPKIFRLHALLHSIACGWPSVAGGLAWAHYHEGQLR